MVEVVVGDAAIFEGIDVVRLEADILAVVADGLVVLVEITISETATVKGVGGLRLG
jgi:hypothetical protein